jgi:hypothetical protein
VEIVLKEHASVKKVALVVAIMQKKIANVETAKLVNVIVISTQHNKRKSSGEILVLFFCIKEMKYIDVLSFEIKTLVLV